MIIRLVLLEPHRFTIEFPVWLDSHTQVSQRRGRDIDYVYFVAQCSLCGCPSADNEGDVEDFRHLLTARMPCPLSAVVCREKDEPVFIFVVGPQLDRR